jgi:hypothetical protein
MKTSPELKYNISEGENVNALSLELGITVLLDNYSELEAKIKSLIGKCEPNTDAGRMDKSKKRLFQSEENMRKRSPQQPGSRINNIFSLTSRILLSILD